MIVMKFGGTSVESAAAIQRVAEIVRSRRKQDPIVVVSAMAKVTDQLVAMGQKAASGDAEGALELLPALKERHLAAAKSLLSPKVFTKIASKLEKTFLQLGEFLRGVSAVHELSPRSSDFLLSFGELLSSQFIAPALTELGLEAQWVDSRECVITDGTHTCARPQAAETRQRAQAVIKPILAKHRIPVRVGLSLLLLMAFLRLSAAAAHYTAAIIGGALNAECIEIWTDVEGMMTTDPRVCPDARTIRRISFNEAAELAYFARRFYTRQLIARDRKRYSGVRFELPQY